MKIRVRLVTVAGAADTSVLPITISKGNAAWRLEVTENVIFSPFKFPKPLNSTQGHGSMDTWKERLFSEAGGHLSLCSQCSYHTGVG